MPTTVSSSPCRGSFRADTGWAVLSECRGGEGMLVAGASESGMVMFLRPIASTHAQMFSVSVGMLKASSSSPQFHLLWGEKSTSVTSWMLQSSVLMLAASDRRLISSAILARTPWRTSFLLLPGPEHPVLQQCSLVPWLLRLQAEQVQGMFSHTSGLFSRWLAMAEVVEESSQVWVGVIGFPVES